MSLLDCYSDFVNIAFEFCEYCDSSLLFRFCEYCEDSDYFEYCIVILIICYRKYSVNWLNVVMNIV